MKKIVSIAVFSVLFYSVPAAQTPLTDPPQTDSPVSAFFRQASPMSELFNGIREAPYPFTPVFSPYYPSPEFLAGSVVFNGVNYPGVMIRWDIYRDQLTVMPAGGDHSIVVDAEKFTEAEIETGTILFSPGGLPPGYCLRVSAIPVEFYIKPSAKLHEDVQDDRIVRTFIHKERYWLSDGERITEIKNENTLANWFGSEGKTLKASAALAGLRFRTAPAATILYYIENYQKLQQ